jgi:hypothetical protein
VTAGARGKRLRGRTGRRTLLILIERRVLREPVVVEMEPRGPRPRPTGFWRGTRFYSIVRVLGRRWERGAAYLRVLADRGCFDLRRVTEMDPWTWRPRPRWELTAELGVVRVPRLPSQRR